MTKDQRESDLSIPQTQRAAVVKKAGGPIEIQSNVKVVQENELKSGEVLVRIIYTGVCHTDLHAMLGDWPMPAKYEQDEKGLIGGHEGAGIVVGLGPNSDQYLQKGDRVGIKWLASSCLNCEFCLKGDEPLCPNQQTDGYTHDGSFCQYAVSYAQHVTKIPESLSLQEVAPILCGGLTSYKAIKKAETVGSLHPGDWVAIVGAGGGLGHLGVQYANAMGYRVLAIDTGDDKKQLAEKCGAKAFIDFKQSKDLVEEVKSLTQGGAHAVINTGSAPSSYQQALEYLHPGGALVAVGLPPGTKVEVDIFWLVMKSNLITGSLVGNRKDAIEAVDLAARGKVKCEYKLMALSDLPKIFDEMKDNKIAGRIVVDVDN